MQSKRMSIIESVANIALGMLVSYALAMLVLPIWFGEVKAHQAIEITAVYTIASFARTYCLRRVFNLRRESTNA